MGTGTGRRPAGRGCLVPGCGRAARPGKAVCGRHERTGAGDEVRRAVARAARDAARAVGAAAGGGEEVEEARRRFRRRLERGDYRGLFDAGVAGVLAEAGRERGLAQEAGALRLAMARLLAEEGDAGKLALGVARLANALARVERTRAAIEGTAEDGLGAALVQILSELDAEEGVVVGDEDDRRRAGNARQAVG